MYAKLFASLYQGTLRGKAAEILVFTNLLAHADASGAVDKHWRAIAEETGLTQEEVMAAIKNLESPDPESRSPEMDGCRITRIDEHRAWGWMIVNYPKYRAIKNEEDRREQNRESQRRWRERHKQTVSSRKQDKPAPSVLLLSQDTTKLTTKDTSKISSTAVDIPDWVPADTWAKFVEHRKKSKHPLSTAHAAELVIKKLAALKAKGYDPKTMLENAIERGWRTVFEPYHGSSKQSSTFDLSAQDYTKGVKPDGTF